MIDGVKITELKQIKDERGKIMHMMKNNFEVFRKFGEIYFSTVNNRYIKAWHLHKEATLNYACIHGKVRYVLFDDRKSSKTFGEIQEFTLSPENYFLVTVPPMIWNGFIGIHKEYSIIANCMTITHDENEMVRKDPFDSYFSYKWI